MEYLIPILILAGIIGFGYYFINRSESKIDKSTTGSNVGEDNDDPRREVKKLDN